MWALGTELQSSWSHSQLFLHLLSSPSKNFWHRVSLAWDVLTPCLNLSWSWEYKPVPPGLAEGRCIHSLVWSILLSCKDGWWVGSSCWFCNLDSGFLNLSWKTITILTFQHCYLTCNCSDIKDLPRSHSGGPQNHLPHPGYRWIGWYCWEKEHLAKRRNRTITVIQNYFRCVCAFRWLQGCGTDVRLWLSGSGQLCTAITAALLWDPAYQALC